jgi:ATP-dependent Clp protease protease subunit
MYKINKPKASSPIIYEKTANGEEMYDIYSRLLKERIIFLDSELDIDNANNIISQLLWLEKQDNDEAIHLYINCYGGELPAMFAVYDVIQFIKPDVYTFVLGIAASAAAVLLCAGKKGCRFALPHSEVMIHEPRSGIEGTTTDMEDYNKVMIKNREKMLKILSRHTGKSYEQLKQDCLRDFYLDSKEALEYGIIDEIKEPKESKPKSRTKKVSRKK